jgi:glycosyltransferase involved in cell wall biosynthesis
MIKLLGSIKNLVKGLGMLDLLIIVPSLRRGGAEKFTVNLFNYLSQSESIELLTISKEGGFYDLVSNKSLVTRLGFKRVATSVLAILKMIRSKRPATILTMFAHLSAIILLFKAFGLINSRVVIREVNLPSRSLKNKRWSFLYKLIYRYLYPFADVVICQSADMYEDIKSYTSANLKVINNPIDAQLVSRLSIENYNDDFFGFDKNKRNILFIGRLTYQKGVDILMDFASMLDEDTVLHVVGAGDLKGWVEGRVRRDNLDSRVLLHGEVENPFPLLNKSDYLIMTSRYEGFPNVALESLVLGIPIITVPFKGGSEELFFQGENSIVSSCFSGESLIESYMSAQELRFDSLKIREYILENFDVSIIANKYKEILY